MQIEANKSSNNANKLTCIQLRKTELAENICERQFLYFQMWKPNMHIVHCKKNCLLFNIIDIVYYFSLLTPLYQENGSQLCHI